MLRLLAPTLLACALWIAGPAHAVYIGNAQGGAEFPQGEISFADAVVSFAVGTGGVTAPYQGAENALGLPDYASGNTCDLETCTFVSLGRGGALVLRFDDNKLTGSGTSDPDLWIFEIGPDVEDTFVAISVDGITWSEVGEVTGSTRGIDIDAYGFGPGDLFAYVRLIDDPNEGQSSGATTGADIDAVGAISTIATPVPEPGVLVLTGLGLAAFGATRTRRGAATR